MQNGRNGNVRMRGPSARHRVNIVDNAHNHARQTHHVHRPRAHTIHRQQQSVTSSNMYSPTINRVSNRAQPVQRVHNPAPAHRRTLNHFKPYVPNLLRYLAAKKNHETTPMISLRNSAVRSTDSTPMVHHKPRPTAQGAPHRQAVQNNAVNMNSVRDIKAEIHTLASHVVQQQQVNPTRSTIIRSEISKPLMQNVRNQPMLPVFQSQPSAPLIQNNRMVPLPSAVPHRGTSNGPLHVVSRTTLANGDVILHVLPIAPAATPTIASLIPVLSSPLQQSLGLIPQTWVNQLVLGGDSTDAPDPTDIVKTVTELAAMLASTGSGGTAVEEEEEEEIEWEDRPPTTTSSPTTTATTTMPPIATSPTKSVSSVIKSIAARIIALLLQRGGTPSASVGGDTPSASAVLPTIQPQLRSGHQTRVVIRPSPATKVAYKDPSSMIMFSGNGDVNSIYREALITAAVSPTVSARREAIRSLVASAIAQGRARDAASNPSRLNMKSQTWPLKIKSRQFVGSAGGMQDIGASSGSEGGNQHSRGIATGIVQTGGRSDSVPNNVDTGIAIAPYMFSNDLGGLSVKRISTPAKEPGTHGSKRISKVVRNKSKQTHLKGSSQRAQGAIAASDLLDKIRLIVAAQATANQTTTVPTTTVPTTTRQTCSPTSPDFRCKGKDLFVAMQSIGAWCIGMCVKHGCIETVCSCGCGLPPSPVLIPPSPARPSPSAMSMTTAQLRRQQQLMQFYGPPPWATTQRPVTTEEPPEDEYEIEDGETTTKKTSSPGDLWWAQWEHGRTSPSPQNDFPLNPLDHQSSSVQKINKHVSKLDEVAWASEIKSRLSKLSANAANSADTKIQAIDWSNNAPSTPPTVFNDARPNWQGTEWHLPTPAPKKPPTRSPQAVQESNVGPPNSAWNRRPLRDKWSRSERFAGPSGNDRNYWNMPTAGWGHGGGGGIDRRFSRLRFSWGRGGSGSGEKAEAAEANDK